MELKDNLKIRMHRSSGPREGELLMEEMIWWRVLRLMGPGRKVFRWFRLNRVGRDRRLMGPAAPVSALPVFWWIQGSPVSQTVWWWCVQHLPCLPAGLLVRLAAPVYPGGSGFLGSTRTVV